MIVGFGIIAGIIGSVRLLQFWIFASTTISLEVCIGCLRWKYAVIEKFGFAAIDSVTFEDKAYFKARLHEAKKDRKWCWVFVGMVLSCWMLVALCEVWHIAEADYNEEKVAVAHDSEAVTKPRGGASKPHLPPLPWWNIYAIALLSGLNFNVAIWKMWVLAGAHVGDSEDAIRIARVRVGADAISRARGARQDDDDAISSSAATIGNSEVKLVETAALDAQEEAEKIASKAEALGDGDQVNPEQNRG